MSNTICEVQIPYDERLTLRHIQMFIRDEATKYGVPVDMNISNNRIVMTHPNHLSDYFTFEVTMWTEYGYIVLRLSQTGKSKQYKKRAFSNAYKQQLTHSYVSSQLELPNSNEYLFKSTINKFRSLGYDENERLKEDRYYNSLISVFKSTFGVN